jgi:hypothetical protein
MPQSNVTPTPSPKWQGYLTLGDIDVAALLSGGLKACFAGENLPSLPVEPGRVFSAAGLVRKKVEVWNQQRTRFRGDEYCLGQLPENDSQEYLLQYAGQPEHLRISGGYQMSVTQGGATIITLRSAVGGGELGSPLSEIPLSDTELPPNDRTYLDGGLDCSEVLRSINGVGGPNLQISSLQGVLVEPHPSLTRIVIDVNGESINYCPPADAAVQVDCVPARLGECGPINDANEPCPGVPNKRGGYVFSSTDPLNPDYTGDSPPGDEPSLPLYGFCDYQRGPNNWELIGSDLAPNCDCSPPTVYGYTGQQLRSPGVPLAVDPMFLVRNPYFTLGLTNWIATGNVNTGTLPELDYMSGVSLLGSATIEQSYLRIAQADRYSLQARYAVTGSATYQVINHRTNQVMIAGDFNSSQSRLRTDFTQLATGDYKLVISSSGTLMITEVGLIRWQ